MTHQPEAQPSHTEPGLPSGAGRVAWEELGAVSDPRPARTWDWSEPQTWACPRCAWVMVTRVAAPVCGRCLFRDDGT